MSELTLMMSLYFMKTFLSDLIDLGLRYDGNHLLPVTANKH